MNISYSRISTGKQDNEGQEEKIRRHCKAKGWTVDRVVSETISSRKEEREIYKLIEELKAGDRIICTELSRLGRGGIAEIGELIQRVKRKKAGLCVITEGLELEPGKELSITSEAILSAISLASKVERTMISERTKAGLVARKAQGVILGRKPGGSLLDSKSAEVRKYYELGLKKTQIAKLCGVSRHTVIRYLKAQEKIRR